MLYLLALLPELPLEMEQHVVVFPSALLFLASLVACIMKGHVADIHDRRGRVVHLGIIGAMGLVELTQR